MTRRPQSAPPVDREQFLIRSHAVLRRIEKKSFILTVAGSLFVLLFSRHYGLSLFLGGLLGMGHFRSLHRMFEKRILDPASKYKSHFYYGLKIFIMTAFYFWAIQWELIRSWGVIAGFFLMTGSVLLGPTQR